MESPPRSDLPNEENPVQPGEPHSADTNDRPITPEDLGLQPDYEDRHIPHLHALRHAAVEALDREMAFMILHRDQPQKIVERLDKLADVARAACQVQGPHQAKAVRLGLELQLGYWLAANKVDDWFHLIMPMLDAAVKMEEPDLQSRVYHMFSIFLYVCREKPGALQIMLDNAMEYAVEAGRDDLRLLIRAESFNARAYSLNVEEARSEADAICMEARRLTYRYAEAMAYVALARNLSARHVYAELFAYAQQAFILFASINVMGQAGAAVMLMLPSVVQIGTSVYYARLMSYLDNLSRQTAIPFLQANTAFFQARSHYERHDYDQARRSIFDAWRWYHAAHHRPGLKRCTHMLGLIQTRRGRWAMAERHLLAAYQYYARVGEKTYAADACYALAFVPYKQGDLPRARPLLVEAQAIARQLPEAPVRDRLISTIQVDIDDIDRRLSEAQPDGAL